MYRDDSNLVYSPTDICRFVESCFASWMDRYALEHPGEVARESAGEELELLRRKGREHEDRYLVSLIEQGQAPVEIQDEPDRFASASPRWVVISLNFSRVETLMIKEAETIFNRGLTMQQLCTTQP